MGITLHKFKKKIVFADQKFRGSFFMSFQFSVPSSNWESRRPRNYRIWCLLHGTEASPQGSPPSGRGPSPQGSPPSGRGPSPLGSPPSGRGPRGAHWLQITVSCVKERIVGRMKKGRKKQREGVKGGGWIKIRQILSTVTSIQSSNHKTNKKTTEANNSVNKLIDRGSWEKLQNVC